MKIIKDKELINSLIKCTMHSTSTGSREGNLNSHLAYTVTCGGQPNQPMTKLVVYPFQASLVPVNDPRWIKGLIGLSGESEPGGWYWVRYRYSRHLLGLRSMRPSGQQSK